MSREYCPECGEVGVPKVSVPQEYTSEGTRSWVFVCTNPTCVLVRWSVPHTAQDARDEDDTTKWLMEENRSSEDR